MGPGIATRHTAEQHHGLGNHQFRDAARVGERRVEHRQPERLGRCEVDLVGADAEAADDNELRGEVRQTARDTVYGRLPCSQP